MDKELVEKVGRVMQRQYTKEMLGARQKWESLTPDERSMWRLLARATIAVVQEHSDGPKLKTASR